MRKKRESASALTDEEVLADFVRRFECDAAILIYKDGDMEHGFLKWMNKPGKQWIDGIKNAVRNREKPASV